MFRSSEGRSRKRNGFLRFATSPPSSSEGAAEGRADVAGVVDTPLTYLGTIIFPLLARLVITAMFVESRRWIVVMGVG